VHYAYFSNNVRHCLPKETFKALRPPLKILAYFFQLKLVHSQLSQLTQQQQSLLNEATKKKKKKDKKKHKHVILILFIAEMVCNICLVCWLKTPFLWRP